jgi:hypothetical protein
LQVQKLCSEAQFSAETRQEREEIPLIAETRGTVAGSKVLLLPYRTRVAATTEEPDMTEVLPSRQGAPARARSFRTYAAVLVFLAVYAGVLVVVFAPRDMISAETGAIFAGSD